MEVQLQFTCHIIFATYGCFHTQGSYEYVQYQGCGNSKLQQSHFWLNFHISHRATVYFTLRAIFLNGLIFLHFNEVINTIISVVSQYQHLAYLTVKSTVVVAFHPLQEDIQQSSFDTHFLQNYCLCGIYVCMFQILELTTLHWKVFYTGLVRARKRTNWCQNSYCLSSWKSETFCTVCQIRVHVLFQIFMHNYDH